MRLRCEHVFDCFVFILGASRLMRWRWRPVSGLRASPRLRQRRRQCSWLWGASKIKQQIIKNKSCLHVFTCFLYVCLYFISGFYMFLFVFYMFLCLRFDVFVYFFILCFAATAVWSKSKIKQQIIKNRSKKKTRETRYKEENKNQDVNEIRQ